MHVEERKLTPSELVFRSKKINEKQARLRRGSRSTRRLLFALKQFRLQVRPDGQISKGPKGRENGEFETPLFPSLSFRRGPRSLTSNRHPSFFLSSRMPPSQVDLYAYSLAQFSAERLSRLLLATTPNLCEVRLPFVPPHSTRHGVLISLTFLFFRVLCCFGLLNRDLTTSSPPVPTSATILSFLSSSVSFEQGSRTNLLPFSTRFG